jgi:hypothetical protein
MPEQDTPVLIYTSDMYQAMAWLSNNRWYYEHQTWFPSEVLYWMPLPPSPLTQTK